MGNNGFEIRLFRVTELGYVDVISIQSNRLRVDTFREDGRVPFYKLREQFRDMVTSLKHNILLCASQRGV
jgi:hypothetical protein